MRHPTEYKWDLYDRRRRAQAGAALIVVAMITVIMSGFAVGYFMLVAGDSRAQFSSMAGAGSDYVVEAAINRALEELRSGIDLDQNGIIGNVQGTFNNTPYSAYLFDPGDGTLIMTGVANNGGERRAAEARITTAPSLPTPGLGAQAALTILGQMNKKGKVDIHIHKPSNQGAGDDVIEEDEEAQWTSQSTSPIAIDGHDAAGKRHDLPGVGIEDAVLYDKVTDKIAHNMYHGKIPADAIIGDPMSTISTTKHGGFQTQASISPLQVNPASLNYTNMNKIAGNIETYVDQTLIPQANHVVSGNNVKISNNTTYGSPGDPKIVVIDGNKVEVQPGVTVTGYGTLIVNGDLSLLNNSNFNWQGEIILMGGKNTDATFKNKKGHLTLDGMLLVLGTSSNKKRSVLSLHNDIDSTHVATTTITGALVVLTGDNTDKAEKAEFKAKHGDFVINGFIGVYGDKTKFDVKIDDKKSQADGSFFVHGGVVVAAPGTNPKDKTKVHLHGDDILIQYHSTYIEDAINALATFGQKMPNNPFPESYQILSWREIAPPQGVLDTTGQ